MRKIYLTLIILFSSTLLVLAQPILNQANFVPVVGESQLYNVADTNTVIDNTIGANVVFNYSGMQGYGQTQTQYIIDPAPTTYGSYFPSATTADSTGGSPVNKNYSELHGTDSLNKVGIIVDVATYGTIAAQYDQNPEIAMKFPFTYGNNFVDNYAGLVTLVANGVTTDGNGTTTVTADAWGTLQLPMGVSIDSVLRVKTVESLVTDTIIIPFVITILPVVIYAEYINYYKPSISKFPLVSVITGTYTQDNNTLDSTKVIISQYPLLTVGVKELKNTIGLNLFPNPSNKNYTTLSFDLDHNSIVKVDLLNNLGQKVNEVFNGNLQEGKNNLKIKTSNLSKGFYFVNVSVGNKTSTKKLIIE